MILPKVRDPRLVTIRRGGTLPDTDHQLLTLWAADCTEHVLPLFEAAVPSDDRPRKAIEAARAWTRGELKMSESRSAAFAANAAANDLKGAAREAAHSAGQAAAVPHVPEHYLGAAAYAIKAARAAASPEESDEAGRLERDWQIARIPEHLLELVLEDQRRRNDICWGVF